MLNSGRKNRKLEVTFDIPKRFESDEDFLQWLEDRLNERGELWTLVGEEAPIKKVSIGEFEAVYGDD